MLLIPTPATQPEPMFPWSPEPAPRMPSSGGPFELAELRPEDLRIIAGSDIEFLQLVTEPRPSPPLIDPQAVPQPGWETPGIPPVRPATAMVLERRRDLIVPRSVVLALILFATLALVVSFLAGYLVGSFGIPPIEIRRTIETRATG